MQHQIWRLHKRPITIIPVQDKHRIPDGGEPVLGYLLQHNGCADLGLDAVVAVAAVADTVAVDFEDDIVGAVFIEEAGGVDAPALVQAAGEGAFAGDVGARWVGGFGDSDADAVVADGFFGFAGVVEDVFSVVLSLFSNPSIMSDMQCTCTYPSNHIRSPMVNLRLPPRQCRQGFFVQQIPALKVLGCSHLHTLAIAVGPKGVPCAIVGLDEAGVWEVGVDD